MPQHRSWSSCVILAVCLMAIVSFGSIAAATDLTISDPTPELFFFDNDGAFTWRIFADDIAFDIIDDQVGSAPFRIIPGAPTYSLFIDSNGRIGLGSGNPATHLHIRTTDILPRVRLQSANNTFPYTWDIEGGVTGFFLIDVAGGGTFPFTVRSGAPEDSLFVDNDGNVGLGTNGPSASLHVRKSAQQSTAEILARFETSDDPVGSLVIGNNSAGDGVFIPKITGRSASQNAALINDAIISLDTGSSPAIVYNAAKGAGGPLVTRPLVVYRNNSVAKVTIAANGNITATSFNPASSRSLKHDIVNLDSQKAADGLRQLTPVEFVYNDDESNEKRVGFIAEDVPELVAAPDRQSVPIMDVVALVTRVVKDQDRLNEQQQKTIDQQQKTIDQQQTTIDELMKRLKALENQASTVR